MAIQQDGARVRLLDATDASKCGGLAARAWTEQCEKLTASDHEVESVQCVDRTERFAQVADSKVGHEYKPVRV